MPKIPSSDESEAIAAPFPHVSNWAVAWTKPRCERSVEDYFGQRGVACFLPLISKRQVYKSGIKNWAAPLFSSYVFYDSNSMDRHKVFESRKVVDILIPPDPVTLGRELSQIALALDRDSSLREARFGEIGRRVRVVRGPMKGLSGELLRVGPACHLILRVDFLGKAAELAIDESCVEPELD
ncbi:MAG: transcription termination/antitermination NusG family protein [Planctomycetota bacterium]